LTFGVLTLSLTAVPILAIVTAVGTGAPVGGLIVLILMTAALALVGTWLIRGRR
jgi:hypothetical protein